MYMHFTTGIVGGWGFTPPPNSRVHILSFLSEKSVLNFTLTSDPQFF